MEHTELISKCHKYNAKLWPEQVISYSQLDALE